MKLFLAVAMILAGCKASHVTPTEPPIILGARVLYVTMDGLDINPCSEALPCTLRVALNDMHYGLGHTTILIGNGEYRGQGEQ